MGGKVQRIPLQVISEPASGPVLHSPPTWVASHNSVDYICGHCGSVLLHAEEDQVRNLQIHCRACGNYNTTE